MTRPGVRPLRRAAGILLDRKPLFQLDVYPEMAVLVRRAGTMSYSSQLIDPNQVAALLGEVPTATGLLAPDLLGSGRMRGKPYYVWLVRPRPVTLGIKFGEYHDATFRIPPLVWGGREGEYRLVALHEQDLDARGWPTSSQIPTYRAPFGNVFATAGICWGTGTKPQPATATGMAAAFEVFLTGSYFNSNEGAGRSKAFPANILLRYDDLNAETPYPCDDLERDGRTLEWLLSGEAWKHGS